MQGSSRQEFFPILEIIIRSHKSDHKNQILAAFPKLMMEEQKDRKSTK
jgi:hypothetical protein